ELNPFAAAPQEIAAGEKRLKDSHSPIGGIGSRLTLRGGHDPGRSRARRRPFGANRRAYFSRRRARVVSPRDRPAERAERPSGAAAARARSRRAPFDDV